MSMKSHILAALQEQFEAWDQLLSGLTDTQANTPTAGADGFEQWSIKDVMAHLKGWQARTLARVDAVVNNRAPVFPAWPEGLEPEQEDVTEINDWIYQTHRNLAWAKVYEDWREIYLAVMKEAQRVPEPAMLDNGRYAWLNGNALVLYLIGTYDHHQEHFEKLSQ